MRSANYDSAPFIAVTDAKYPCFAGWDTIAAELKRAISRGRIDKPILVVDCYPGVDEVKVLEELKSRLSPKLVIQAAEAYHPPEKIEKLVAPFLGSDETSFGRFSNLSLVNFFDAEPLWRFRRIIDELKEGLVLIVGCGASLIAWGHILVYADLTRQSAQERLQDPEAGNLAANNKAAAARLKYKRAFFVDWRTADRWKRPLIRRWDYLLDTNHPMEPKLAEAGDVRLGMRESASRPFRWVPVLESTSWGRAENNGARVSIECAPEQNSLTLGLGDARIEIPALDLVHYQARELLGEGVHLRFPDGFPIRFSLVDVMAAGDHWFQVHPVNDFVRQHFGARRAQDENHYILEAAGDARVHLGLRAGVDPGAMQHDLETARAGGEPFTPEKYTRQTRAGRHDHFLISAGTIHGSGGNSLALHIAGTPYILPFDLWNWGALSWNGKAMPIQLQPARTTASAGAGRLRIDIARKRAEEVGTGDGWREERLALGTENFIELRRHWFRKAVPHNTQGGVNVLTLVEGEEAVVESPSGAFAPYVVHYLETFIVPAAVGEYTIRPHGPREGKQCGTIKAFVHADGWS